MEATPEAARGRGPGRPFSCGPPGDGTHGQAHGRSQTVEAALSPTTQVLYRRAGRRLAEDQVQELLRRLKKDYHVKDAVVLENRRE